MTMLAVPLGPDLTRTQAEAIVAQGKEATIFALLQFAKLLAERARPAGPAPSTPSGMIPPYLKPTATEGKPRGSKKQPGARPGHAGARRPVPEQVDHDVTQTLDVCPDCGAPVRECRARRRKRYIEDIPEDLKAEVTEHTIPGYWCGQCRKEVEPAVLVSDFWGPYHKVVAAARQKCLVHLLRDLKHVEKHKQPGPQWPAFAKKLRRLVADALRLKAQQDALPADVFATRRERFPARLEELIATLWEDRQSRRLIQRLKRHRHELFTFRAHADVPFDNNLAERAIHPAVIIRKNSYCNRSERGADIQAVLMSIYRTLTQRGHPFLETITQALRTYITTGQLPPLPAKNTGFG